MAEKTVPLDLALILVWIQLPSLKTKKLTPKKRKIPPPPNINPDGRKNVSLRTNHNPYLHKVAIPQTNCYP